MVIDNPNVKKVFDGYTPELAKKLMTLRKYILDIGKNLPETGGIEETLKWGEPSYLPKQKNVGTTVRIHGVKSKQYGIYFNCNTSLIEMFKMKYADLFRYEGKRAIIFSYNETIPIQEIKDCISMALTYHLKKH